MELNLSKRKATLKSMQVTKMSPGQENEQGVLTLGIECMLTLDDCLPIIGLEKAVELRSAFWDVEGNVTVADEVGLSTKREFTELDVTVLGHKVTGKARAFVMDPSPLHKFTAKFRVIIVGAESKLVAKAFDQIAHGIDLTVESKQADLVDPQTLTAVG